MGVVSNEPGAPGLERAERAGLATRIVPHRDFATREAFDAALVEAVDAFEPNLVVLAGFLLLFARGMLAARRAPEYFGGYLALGLTCMLVLQALLNMCICLGMLPTTGLPLPFISYGGSSLLMSMTAMGLLLNVSQHAT